MDITYFGDNSFLVKGEQTVAVNPAKPVKDATVNLYGKKLSKNGLVVNGPGEYEIGDVLIVSRALGERGSGELAHSFVVGDLNVVYLGNKVRPLDERDVLALGKIDVLIVNTDALPAAREIVRDLLPRVVIPFGSGAAELAKTLGLADAQPQPRFSWNGVVKAPAAVLLKPQKSAGQRAA